MISLCTAYLGLKTYEIQKGCAYVSRKEISCRKHLQREYEVLYVKEPTQPNSLNCQVRSQDMIYIIF